MPSTKKVAKKSTTVEPVVATFTFDRATKNTFRFAEDGDEPIIGTLYVQKAAFDGGKCPASLTVQITPSAETV